MNERETVRARLATVPLASIDGSRGRELDRARVAYYLALPRGDWPRVKLVERDGAYSLADGRHRASAARMIGARSIRACVVSQATWAAWLSKQCRIEWRRWEK